MNPSQEKQTESLVPDDLMESPYGDRVEELIKRYERLYTGAVLNVFLNRQMPRQWLGPQVKCLTRELRREAVAGFAFTVQWIHDPNPDDREMPAARMVASYPRGAVVVVDTGGDRESGFWGELATTRCVDAGVRGAVINGCARDLGFVREMGFPIFARASSPVDGFYKSRLRGWQRPIWFNDVLVRPWDFILADADGAVVIPYEIAEAVLEETEALCAQESKLRALLREGVTPSEAVRRSGAKDL
jgi:4-hydroxy-4-methyl-2-oxoglutarate aldolase